MQNPHDYTRISSFCVCFFFSLVVFHKVKVHCIQMDSDQLHIVIVFSVDLCSPHQHICKLVMWTSFVLFHGPFLCFRRSMTLGFCSEQKVIVLKNRGTKHLPKNCCFFKVTVSWKLIELWLCWTRAISNIHIITFLFLFFCLLDIAKSVLLIKNSLFD